MHERLEELLGVRGIRYKLVPHLEAFTAQEEAANAHRLKGLIGRGEIRLASVEEILAGFPGCALGATPPFGRLFGIPTVVDESLVEQRDIVLPSGDHRTAIRMRATDYVTLAEARSGYFAFHESEEFPVHPHPRAPVTRPSP